MINGSMISGSDRENSQSINSLKYRFPLWLTIFFLLLVLVPILIFSNQLFLAKISGLTCLILVIVALRVWLSISKINSSKVARVVLNNNQIFDLERKYTFLKTLANSEKQILFHRTGLLLAELSLISDDEISLSDRIELAFNISILIVDNEYKSYNGLSFEISKFKFDKDFSLSVMDDLYSKNMMLSDYKAKLSNSDAFDKLRVKLADF